MAFYETLKLEKGMYGAHKSFSQLLRSSIPRKSTRTPP